MTPLTIVLLISSGLAGISAIPKEAYPNPYTSPERCWPAGSNPPAQLKVCDPENIMGDDVVSLRRIQDAVERVSNSTRCPCGEDDCRIMRLIGASSGYRISVVLAQTMNESTGNKVAAAKEYTTYLRRYGGYYWYPFANCAEDVIVFLSYTDRVVYILTGQKVRARISDDNIRELIVDSRSRFSESVYSGLLYLIQGLQEYLV